MQSHKDYIAQIGETNATGRTYIEKKWNAYYLFTYQKIVTSMMKNEPRGSVLDVGTSHGNWYQYLHGAGFGRILGIELDPGRAKQARQVGYDEVFNCDAANTPIEEASVDLAVSNDVFVHILQLEDKTAVLREMHRVLKPEGVFIVNHSMSPAFGQPKYYISEYCSFLSPAEWIQLAMASGFAVEDVKPSYYLFRKASLLRKALRTLAVAIPFGIGARILCLSDNLFTRWLDIGQSDYVYLKLRKPVVNSEKHGA